MKEPTKESVLAMAFDVAQEETRFLDELHNRGGTGHKMTELERMLVEQVAFLSVAVGRLAGALGVLRDSEGENL